MSPVFTTVILLLIVNSAFAKSGRRIASCDQDLKTRGEAIVQAKWHANLKKNTTIVSRKVNTSDTYQVIAKDNVSDYVVSFKGSECGEMKLSEAQKLQGGKVLGTLED